jgi:AcrR family transcriptional regulator
MSESDAEADLLRAVFDLIAENGWGGLRMDEVARRAGRPLEEVYEAFPTQYHALRALGRRLDKAMLGIEPDELEGMSPRERLFELIMRRLDATLPYRPGLRRLGRLAALDPMALLVLCGNMDRMARWLLDAGDAGVPGPFLDGAARQAITLLYARVFKVWLKDETTDLARTLAELDKRLGQAERAARLARRFSGRPRRRDEPSAA